MSKIFIVAFVIVVTLLVSPKNIFAVNGRNQLYSVNQNSNSSSNYYVSIPDKLVLANEPSVNVNVLQQFWIYLKEQISQFFNTANNTSNKTILKSDLCKLSLKYPKDWNGKITDSPYGCLFLIKDSKNPINFMMLNNVQNTTWAKLVASHPKATPKTVSGVEGITLKVEIRPNLEADEIYFHKGDVIYSISYGYNDSKSKEKVEAVINSIAFTAPDSEYTEIKVAN